MRTGKQAGKGSKESGPLTSHRFLKKSSHATQPVYCVPPSATGEWPLRQSRASSFEEHSWQGRARPGVASQGKVRQGMGHTATGTSYVSLLSVMTHEPGFH